MIQSSRKRRALGGALSALFLLLSGAPAMAQQEALNRFDQPVAGDDFISVFGPGVSGHLLARGAATLDYGNRPYVLKNNAGVEVAALSESQLYVHVGGSLALWDRLLVSLDLPLALHQTGDTIRIGLFRQEGSTGGGLGDLRLGARVRLFRDADAPFSFSLGAFTFVPTATNDWTGAGHVYGEPQALVGGRHSNLKYSGYVGVRLRPSEDPTSLTFGLGAAALFFDDALSVGPEVRGSYDTSSPDLVPGVLIRGSATSAEARLGAQYRIGDRFVVGGAGGIGLASAVGTPDFRLLARVAFDPKGKQPLPPRDEDRDGIPDSDDACFYVPGVWNVDPAKHGCPPEPLAVSNGATEPRPAPTPPDHDGDGIVDPIDACFMVPGVPDPDPTKNGCPADRDGDGYVDESDTCPDAAGVGPDGCPDRDGDGVKDRLDECPDKPGPGESGCPDSDGDDIVDSRDACPDERGAPHTEPKKHGCPSVRAVGEQIELIEPIEFDDGKATLRPAGEATVDALALFIREHPEVLLIEIQGHTAEFSKPERNRALSYARARAILDGLKTRGVARNRVTAVGLGNDRPRVKGQTPEAKAENRRIVLRILKSATPAPAATEASAPEPAKAPPNDTDGTSSSGS